MFLQRTGQVGFFSGKVTFFRLLAREQLEHFGIIPV
jgi:hypothetical protein